MKEFWLGILKNIITYLVVLVMAFVGLVSLTSGEFPPSVKALKAGLERMRKSYASLAKMQDLVAGTAQSQSSQLHEGETAAKENPQADPMAAVQSMMAAQGEKGAPPDLAATMALMQGMMQQMGGAQQAAQGQMQPQVHQLDPNVLKQLTKIEQQNNELIQRLSRIQTYLTGLHQFLGQLRTQQTQPAQQQAVQQATQNRVPTSAPQHPRR